jgi:hypothetical protein
MESRNWGEVNLGQLDKCRYLLQRCLRWPPSRVRPALAYQQAGDLPRSELSEDTLKSINLPSTVFRINIAAEGSIIAGLRKRGVV